MWSEIDRLLATTAVAWGFAAVRGRDGRIRLKRARAPLERGAAAIDEVLRRTGARRKRGATVDERVVRKDSDSIAEIDGDRTFKI